MKDTKEGIELRDELVEQFTLYGLFPCNHATYSEWADWYNHWMDDMLRYYRTNEGHTCEY